MFLNTKFFTAVFLLVSISTLSFCQQDIRWYRELSSLSTTAATTLKKETINKLELARVSGDTAEQILCFNTLGLLYYKNDRDPKAAIASLIDALTLEVHSRRTQDQVITYLAISEVLADIGGFDRAKDAVQKAVRLNQAEDLETKAVLWNQLGMVCNYSKQLDEAYEAFERVIQLKDQLEDHSLIADAYFNRAITRREQLQFAESLADHKEALAIRRMLKDEKGKAISHNVIGTVYVALKNPQRALDNFNVALDIYRVQKDTAGQASVLNNIGALYHDQQQFDKAIENLKQALDYARTAGSNEEIKNALFNLSSAYKGVGQFQEALRYKDDYDGIAVMIKEEEDLRELVAQQAESELGVRESQVSNLEEAGRQKQLEIESQKEVQLYLLGIIALGGVVVLMILFLYISNKRSSRKLKIINQKVQEQNLQLQELNATKDKFFSIISHDLKGPLNSLTSFSGLLINHTDSLSKDEIQLLAKDLDKSVKNLFNLLENLLEWSRSQTGNIEFKGESFDVSSLLELNKQLLEPQAQTKGISIVNSNNQSCLVNVHKHSINTVIRNLVSNAIKFTPAGGKITLTLAVTNGKVKISVSDTGVGMSQEVLAKLFRIDTKITTKGTADEKGTGLGLILCKDFVEKNGGTIWVESVVGKGSTFHFTLPAEVAAVPASI